MPLPRSGSWAPSRMAGSIGRGARAPTLAALSLSLSQLRWAEASLQQAAGRACCAFGVVQVPHPGSSWPRLRTQTPSTHHRPSFGHSQRSPCEIPCHLLQRRDTSARRCLIAATVAHAHSVQCLTAPYSACGREDGLVRLRVGDSRGAGRPGRPGKLCMYCAQCPAQRAGCAGQYSEHCCNPCTNHAGAHRVDAVCNSCRRRGQPC
jgi:hypothetical protein